MKKALMIMGIIAISIMVGSPAFAAIVTTSGAGSAVISATANATFDSVNDYTDLTNYSENGISVTTPRNAYTSYDPTYGNGGFSGGFHYPCGGISAFTSISMVDASDMYAVEFNIGTGFYPEPANINPDVYVYWQVLDGATIIDSGTLNAVAGSVLGFYSDTDAFTLLQIGSYSSSEFAMAVDTTGFNGYNALALDNLKIQATQGNYDGEQQPVPEPATMLLSGIGLVGLALRRKK